MEQTSVKLLYLEIKERHLNPGIFHYWKLEMSKAHEIYIYIYIWRDIFLKTKSLTLSLYSSQSAGNTYPMKITTPISSEERRVSTCFPKKKSEVRPQLIFFNKALQSRVKDLLAKAIQKILQQTVQMMNTLMHEKFNVDDSNFFLSK